MYQFNIMTTSLLLLL